MRAAASPLVAALLLTGCGFFGRKDSPAKGRPEDALRLVDAAEDAAARDPAQLYRACWLRYLIASDTAAAARHCDAAVRRGGPEAVWALAFQAEAADQALDAARAATLWSEVLRRAPVSPAAELAATRLFDLEGESDATDDVVVETSRTAPAPLAPRAARLLRDAAARAITRRTALDGAAEAGTEAYRQAGFIQRWRVGGPYAALRLFDLSKPLPFDGPAEAAAPPSPARVLQAPDGDVGLELEPGEGDLYLAASQVTLAKGGDYLLSIEGASALEVRLDGDVAIARSPWPRATPRAQTTAVRLAEGAHAVLVRWSRAEGARFRLALVRADGAPSDAASKAPAALRGWRTPGPCALGSSCIRAPAWTDPADLRAWASRMAERDPADPLSPFFAARIAFGDDRDEAREDLERAVALSGGGAPALALQALALLQDPDVPERIGRGRVLSMVQEAARKDPAMLRLRLAAAGLERNSERYDDAASELDKAEAALRTDKDRPLPARLLVARAQLAEARGDAQGALRLARAADERGHRCDAAQLLADVARKEGDLARQDQLTKRAAACPDGLAARVEFLRERGDLSAAQALLERSLTLRPGSSTLLEQLGDLLVARGNLPGAIRALRQEADAAPRSAEPLRKLAGVLELAGDRAGALATRKAALRLAPGDLGLRKQVAADEGRKLMAWADRDALPLARAPAPKGLAEGASALRLLDYGATEMFDDGGGVERIHTLIRVFDKRGIEKAGEVQVPQDAQVLHLRTLKADGRVLEPESIPEKEAVSLPGLEPGDAVELEYERGLAPRGPDLPGWSLGAFYFRDDDAPMLESTYEVRSATPLEVDAHRLTLPPGAVTPRRFFYSARDVQPLLAEPHGLGESELMPWVQIGAGAGQAALVRSLADWVLLRARASSATDALARAAGSSSPRETTSRIYAAVAQAVRGRSRPTDFFTPAAHILAQGRGNRLLVLKAALASANIRSHVVLVRPFGADPGPTRFPRADALSYAVLRVDLPEGPLWADPSYRLAPLGELPAFARGQAGWVLPEPGEEPVEVQTPASFAGAEEGRELVLELKLDPDGAASGTARDTQMGFEAASLKDSLERLDQAQRRQAVEAMLGRGLRGLELRTLATEREAEPGGAGVLVSTLRAQLGRKDDAQLFVPASPVPLRLGRRWAEKAERASPLLLDVPDHEHLRTVLTLPGGMHLRGAPPKIALRTPFGSYDFEAKETSGAVVLDERIDVPQQRVPPGRYADFVAFVRAVDAAQEQELRLAR